ncbi:MAG: GTP-binding protein [Actinomycetota bacterium]|nr:GTP-binding protein [Actinomycetota bacterium]
MTEIAVSVIGGYLGAGKTTLVNNVLRNADERIAVLVNDFGDINIDEDLIESRDGDTLSLSNGCICCSLIDGLAGALHTIRELDPRPDRLVIEASGVADPATVAGYAHGNGLTLDAVVVLADVETVQQKCDDPYVGDTVVAQLGAADFIVLNKIDLVEPAKAAAVRRWLASRWPAAYIVETSQAAVPSSILFGRPAAPRPEEPHHNHIHEHRRHDGHTGPADSVFETWSWTGTDQLTRAAVERLMGQLPPDVVRAKGTLWLDTEPDRVTVLQRVGHRWSLRSGTPWEGPAESRVVCIGLRESIDQEWLAAQLTGEGSRAH